jgi:diguanylate cyclase (GGDEF)-like protein
VTGRKLLGRGCTPAGLGSMRLRTKILALLAVPVVILVITVAVALRAERATDESLLLVQHTFQVKETIGTVLDDLVDAETGMRGYLLTGRDDFLTPYTDGTATLANDLRRLAFLTQDNPAQVRRVSNLRLLSSERLRILEQLRPFAPITAARHPGLVDPILEDGRVIMVEIRSILDAMTAEENRLLGLRQASLRSARHQAFIVESVALPLGVLLGLVSVFVFTGQLARRLRAIERNAGKLEEGVPLDPPENGQDEVGHLSRAIAEIARRIAALQDDLRRAAAVDPLTHLNNRRGFLPIAEHQLRIAQRTREPVALVFVDVDGLKHVNDTLGHAVGDTLIAEAAVVLRTTFRASDLPARMGGDEFCVLLRGDSARSAERAVERLQQAVRDANAEPGRAFELSLSVGIARFDPDRPVSIDRLIEDADGLMYTHKRAKRGLAPAR